MVLATDAAPRALAGRVFEDRGQVLQDQVSDNRIVMVTIIGWPGCEVVRSGRDPFETRDLIGQALRMLLGLVMADELVVGSRRRRPVGGQASEPVAQDVAQPLIEIGDRSRQITGMPGEGAEPLRNVTCFFRARTREVGLEVNTRPFAEDERQ
jgi:hypothetical protein